MLLTSVKGTEIAYAWRSIYNVDVKYTGLVLITKNQCKYLITIGPFIPNERQLDAALSF